MACLASHPVSQSLATLGFYRPAEKMSGSKQERKPCLTVVDAHSFAILQLSPQAERDAVTWGVSFLDLQEQGIHFQDVAYDGAC